MSLYNHAANKEDILDGVVDAVVSDLGSPALGFTQELYGDSPDMSPEETAHFLQQTADSISSSTAWSGSGTQPDCGSGCLLFLDVLLAGRWRPPTSGRRPPRSEVGPLFAPFHGLGELGSRSA